MLAAGALLAGAGSAAAADLRAVYRNGAGAALTLEVAANGDSRADFDGQPFYILIRDRVGYVVYRKTAAYYTASIADLQRLTAERVTRSMVSQTSSFGLAERGTVTIAGHSGRALYSAEMPADMPVRPFLVISDDAAMAALSAPLLAQLAFQIATVQAAGREVPPAVVTLQQQLGRGAPLLVLGYSLESLTRDPIDRVRFAFPSTPLTAVQLRQHMPQP